MGEAEHVQDVCETCFITSPFDYDCAPTVSVMGTLLLPAPPSSSRPHLLLDPPHSLRFPPKTGGVV